MTAQSTDRLFGTQSFWHDPLAVWVGAATFIALAVAPGIFWLIDAAKPINPSLRRDLWQRWRSWLILVPMMMLPVVLGAAYVIVAVGVLSLACFREYARATGLFRDRAISAVVVMGILGITAAVFDHWYALFVSMGPITVVTIAVVAVFRDHPKGYVQRVGLGVLGFMLCGVCLGHLGYFANDARYRDLLFWLVPCVELNDIFAYICGKSFGRRKLAPNTSPNKTIGGAVGAMVLTTTLAASLAAVVFRHTIMEDPARLIFLGLIVSVLGQLGDLLLSSIKRDVGIKDMGTLFPGHGGVLDRFNSLLLVSPAVFHFVGYYMGIGLDQPSQILSSAW